MSYLTLSNGIPDFNKAVISLWFRVPQATVDAAKAAASTDVLPKTIPLLTFGDGPTIINWQPNSPDVAVAMNISQAECPDVFSPTAYNNIGTFPISPCYIGLNCNVAPGANPTLTFNLQTAGFAIQHDTFHSLSRIEVYSLGTLPPPSVGDPRVPGNGWNEVAAFYYGYAAGFVDLSSEGISWPEYFLIQTREPKIEPDQWHHLLLSFDLSSGVTTHQREDVADPGTVADATSAYCKLWYAVDDVDYAGETNRGPFALEGGDPNGILTSNAWFVARSFHRLLYNTPVPVATYDFNPVFISSSDQEMGLPASAKYVENIYRVEMAELQFFTGVTLDTAITKNRRAFVDADGMPVKPTGTENDPRSPAEKLLGKKPDVLLHGSGNWKIGKNTGTLGIVINDDGEEVILPTGQFKPTAAIEAYKPDPSIEHSTA